MRMVFVLSSLYLSGGVQVVIECANRLAARGHKVSLVAPRDTLDDEIGRRLMPNVVCCYSRANLRARAGALSQIRLALSLTCAIPAADIIVATHTPTVAPVLLATLLRPQERAWLFMDYAEMFTQRPVESFLWRNSPRFFKRIGVLSQASQHDAMCLGAKQAVVIGLGITNAEQFVPRRDVYRGDSAVAMYLGDARPRKGLAEFLAAAKIVQQAIPDLELLIVTKEPLSIESCVPHTIVLKPDRAALPDLYRRADVFVSTSWGEGFGLPPLEAMACGTPVVLTDSRGVRDYAKPDTNCVMVQPGNIEQLAAAIIHVLSDRSFAQKVGLAGTVTAARFQWDECVDRLEVMLRT